MCKKNARGVVADQPLRADRRRRDPPRPHHLWRGEFRSLLWYKGLRMLLERGWVEQRDSDVYPGELEWRLTDSGRTHVKR